MVEPAYSSSSSSAIQKLYELYKPLFKGATEEEVVTRFPPEPSGFLHIGHIKPAMLNYHFAKMYKGKFILRFDDTNPAIENSDYVQAIMDDLAMLGILPDIVSYSSDYFDIYEDFMTKAITEGIAYCDDSSVETMRKQRMEKLESKYRNTSPDENLQIWAQMREGKAQGWCVRGKINMSAANACMRDPVFYRCSDVPHYRVGTKYKVYPTYDWACPIADSIEDVTHALRSLEFSPRNELYAWVLDTLKLRKPDLVEFATFNLNYMVLSKRKLQWFLDTGRVEGWDDPRMPTVRGLMRRGLTKETLTEFMLEQAKATTTSLQDWSKLWALNKVYIDPQAGRYFAISKERICTLKITNQELEISPVTVPIHPKNSALGNKALPRSNTLYLEYEDGKELKVNEKITLMKWGDCIIKSIRQEGEEFHLEGEFAADDTDFTATKKLNWLPKCDLLVNVHLHEYNHLVKVPKFDAFEEDFESVVNEKSEIVTQGFGEPSLRALPESRKRIITCWLV